MIPVTDRDLDALLQQTAIWRSHGDHAHLVTHLIDDMTPDHRARVLAWLRGNAELMQNLHRDHITRLYKRGLLSVEEFAAELAYLDAMPAAVWLEDQPLVRRLVQLVPREPLPARGVLARIRRGWKR